MGNDQTVELNQRLIVVSISLALGVVFIAVMSNLFEHLDSQVGAFLLDRHTENFPYPFTIQNVMWLMFSVGCGELWVRFSQSNLELEQASRKCLPEDDEDEPVLTPTELSVRNDITMGNTVVRFVPFCGEDFDWQSTENDEA